MERKWDPVEPAEVNGWHEAQAIRDDRGTIEAYTYPWCHMVDGVEVDRGWTWIVPGAKPVQARTPEEAKGAAETTLSRGAGVR